MIYDDVLEVTEVKASVLGSSQVRVTLKQRGTYNIVERGPEFSMWVDTDLAPRVGNRVRVTIQVVNEDPTEP